MYVTREELVSELPPMGLVDALDDDRDGQEDPGVLDLIIQSASTKVDSFLASRYAVPLTDPPALVRRAAKVFVLETIYRRRPDAGKNPWEREAKSLEDHLVMIMKGLLPLDAMTEPQNVPGAVVAEDVRSGNV